MNTLKVRAEEYRVVPREDARHIGLTDDRAARQLEGLWEIAILKCVDDQGRRLTALGEADTFLDSLAADGGDTVYEITLRWPQWRVLFHGWQH